MNRSKLEIIEQLLKEYTESGDLVIELDNKAFSGMYILRERVGVGHYKLTLLTRSQAETLRDEPDVFHNLLPLTDKLTQVFHINEGGESGGRTNQD